MDLVIPLGGEMNGQTIYKTPLDVPKAIEAAVIVVPAKFAVESAEQCMKKGAKYIIIVPGGFKETKTEEGLQRQLRLVELAKQYNCRIIGPNCMGVYDPTSIDTLFVGEEGCEFISPIILVWQSPASVPWASSPRAAPSPPPS